MTPVSTATTVAELVLDRPSRARLFEQLGLDYCCGGKRSLGDACEAKGLDADTVLPGHGLVWRGPLQTAVDAARAPAWN